MNLERWVLLISAVAGALAGVVGAAAALLPLFGITNLSPHFGFLEYPVRLWIVLVIVAISIWLFSLVHRSQLRPVQVGPLPPPRPEPTRFRITNARRLDEKPNKFLIEGQFDRLLEPGYYPWLVTAALTEGLYWPQGEIKLDTAKKEWQRKIGLGPTNQLGEKMRVYVYLVNEAGHMLFEFHTKTVDSDRAPEKRRLPLSKLPPDAIERAYVDLEKLPS